jgi:membrane protein involved in colicin uptake
MSGYFGETELPQRWTPERLRAKTLEANKGFETKRAAEEAARRERVIQQALEEFDKDADEQSAKGEREAIGFSCDVAEGTKTYDDMPAADKAMFDHMRKLYEARGFKTYIKGPWTDGGPSHVTIGFSLMVTW